jgi:hypothetical protein
VRFDPTSLLLIAVARCDLLGGRALGARSDRRDTARAAAAVKKAPA